LAGAPKSAVVMSASRLQHAIFNLALVKVEHLASHILGRLALRISADCSGSTASDLLLETFVDPERFRGTVTVRPTGWCWARRRDVVNNAIATCRTGRSKRFWDIH